jgi:signal transduction histidine kinase
MQPVRLQLLIVGLVQLDSHGLGLTLVRQIMRAHQGTATFYNRATGGCGVTLELPIVVLQR